MLMNLVLIKKKNVYSRTAQLHGTQHVFFNTSAKRDDFYSLFIIMYDGRNGGGRREEGARARMRGNGARGWIVSQNIIHRISFRYERRLFGTRRR